MNLNARRQLLCTPLFTNPSVLFPEFFTIASITSIGCVGSTNARLKLLFSYQSLLAQVETRFAIQLITDTNNFVSQLKSQKWLKSPRALFNLLLPLFGF